MAGGRPKKEIDKLQFEKLCGLQCTEDEICGFFDVTDKTLTRWCKETYNASFSEVFAQKRGMGKISLRRMQWKLAEKNPSMAIFLGKNYLGQTDAARTDVTLTTDDGFIEALTGTARDDWDDEAGKDDV